MSEPTIKRLYIIRHGETELNKNKVVQGRGVDADLNDTGRAQAEAFYQRYKNVPFDKIYTSALKRTHQTVAKFIEKGIAWEQLPGLDEIAWGNYEGKKHSPELDASFIALVESWNKGQYDNKAEGGESPNEVHIRQMEAIAHILSHRDEKTVLVCMHGRALRLLLCGLMKKPFDQMEDFPHQNTSLYILDYDYERDLFMIETFNSTAHLQ
ncbi:phosphoglycerate mutase [Pelobium manganitolerans]|uniref:Phosphoglycerate mutase n=1 Tax=Pelobium manganitolerans TaxID=1842495 RepID=A0A419S497_9SPHI|nr:histidine phosphatase family protein [Pelobium manganitolerans]RKD14489.1 phosphoglycerate mutase [Pelobium manganitolerans]